MAPSSSNGPLRSEVDKAKISRGIIQYWAKLTFKSRTHEKARSIRSWLAVLLKTEVIWFKKEVTCCERGRGEGAEGKRGEEEKERCKRVISYFKARNYLSYRARSRQNCDLQNDRRSVRCLWIDFLWKFEDSFRLLRHWVLISKTIFEHESIR